MSLSVVRLSSLGGYYDELHQAVPTFAYLGKEPLGFAALVVDGYPLLNQTYSGAIKTAVYGLWMTVSGTGFDLLSWRLLGIVIVALALFFLMRKLIRSHSATFGIVFLTLFMTDAALIIQVRHDWGPVAFALALRLLLLALLCSLEERERPSARICLAYGFVLGLSVFEKLSNVVVVAPFALLFCAMLRRRRMASSLFMFLGAILGLLPLAVANFVSYSRTHTLVSLGSMEDWSLIKPAAEYGRIFSGFFSLGSGASPRQMVFGVSPTVAASTELALISALFFLVVLAGVAGWRSRDARRALLFISSYVLIALGLAVLPQQTKNIHWIIGTPLQYMAIALIVQCLRRNVAGPMRALTIAFAIVLVPFLGTRLFGLATLQYEFAVVKHDAMWSPDLNRVAEFARANKGHSLFVSLDWGAGSALICSVDGDADTFVQVNYLKSDAAYVIPGPLKRRNVRDIYVVDTKGSLFVDAKDRAARAGEIESLLGSAWRRSHPDPALSALSELEIVRFARTD